MRTVVEIALVGIVLLSGVTLALAQPPEPAMVPDLRVGDRAPDFTLQASDGKEYTLAQFAGKSAVAICWYPHITSGGTKTQFAALEAAVGQIPRDKVQVFGCGTADLEATKAAAEQGKYSFPLLSDPDGSVARAYGCLQAGGAAARWTVLIDDKGTVLSIGKAVTPASQGTEMLKALVAAKILPADTVIAAAPAASAPAAAQAPKLKVGDKAPDFKLMGSDGKEYTLAQFSGKLPVVLAFCRQAGSGGTRTQCQMLEAALPSIPKDKVQLVAGSPATLDATKTFMQQGKYSFPMLADDGGTVSRAYGCFRANGQDDRVTFLIDDKGVILAIQNIDATPEEQGKTVLKMLVDAKLLPADTVVAAGAPAPVTAGPVQAPAAGPTARPKVGDKSPALKLMGSDGTEYALDQFAGKSYVALLWLRRAGSGGSTQQCQSVAAAWDKISKYNVRVFGVSSSSLSDTQDFAAKMNCRFPLLADPGGTVGSAYGAARPDGMCQRITFLVDPNGVIVAEQDIDTQPSLQADILLQMLDANNVTH
jgi:peroxiredoxin Q/BCP